MVWVKGTLLEERPLHVERKEFSLAPTVMKFTDSDHRESRERSFNTKISFSFSAVGELATYHSFSVSSALS